MFVEHSVDRIIKTTDFTILIAPFNINKGYKMMGLLLKYIFIIYISYSFDVKISICRTLDNYRI